MGNRLRSQLTHAGLEAPVSSRGPETAEPERDRASSAPDGQPGPLSALEQLQYRLTTQELQYAQREQRTAAPVVVRPLYSDSESGGRARHRDKAANPWVQGSGEALRHERSSSKENTPPPLGQSRSPVQRDPGSRPSSSPPGALLSSLATEGSLREVWQMMDQGLSPSPSTTPRPSSETGNQVEMSRCELTEASPEGPMGGLQGTRAPVQDRRPTTRPTNPPTRPKNTKTGGRGSRIRNYNVKD